MADITLDFEARTRQAEQGLQRIRDQITNLNAEIASNNRLSLTSSEQEQDKLRDSNRAFSHRETTTGGFSTTPAFLYPRPQRRSSCEKGSHPRRRKLRRDYQGHRDQPLGKQGASPLNYKTHREGLTFFGALLPARLAASIQNLLH